MPSFRSDTVIPSCRHNSLPIWPITNNGTINYTSTYYSYMSNNAVLTNNGNIDFQGDNGLYQSGPVGTTAIVNNTIFKKSGRSEARRVGKACKTQSVSQLHQQTGSQNMAAVPN